ncbi:hypothetical protein Tco_0835412, partial [Tanacetum coccineum]
MLVSVLVLFVFSWLWDLESRKMKGTKESNDATRIYIVDGKPLKSMLKKPRGSTHIANGNHAKSVVYNKNFPRLGTNRPNGAGHDKDMTEKLIQVRPNVEIAHEDSNTIWEVKNDFASPLNSVWVDEPEMCDKPIGESKCETISQHDVVSGTVRMDTKDSGHDDGSDENLRVESGLNIAKSTP